MRRNFQRILGGLFLILLTSPGLWACPRCVDATPYKLGLQMAVVVLLPVPLVLGFLIYRWLKKSEEAATE
jgi:hypothetical protein